MVQTVTKDTFEEKVLNSKGRVLVDFSAVWCGPCNMIAPILNEISEEYADKVSIVKIDTDVDHELAMQYGIVSIPALILFEDGKPSKRTVGAMPKEQILAFLDL